MTPGALLLLLAVAAGQVGSLSAVVITSSGGLDISSCDINYYGKTYTLVDVKLNADSSVEICFKNTVAEVSLDCIHLDDRWFADQAVVTVNDMVTNTSQLQAALPNLVSSSSCYVEIALQGTAIDVFHFRIYDFGQQAALQMKTFMANERFYFIETKVNASQVDAWGFTDADLSDTRYYDLSACRVLGQIKEVNTTISHPETCSQTVCSEAASLDTVSICQSWEECEGNNACVPKPLVCTVSGSTVIDFSNQLHSVPDRCVYTLVSPSGTPNFGVLAGFRERRLQDVPLLDNLVLMTGGPMIQLKQGGRVEVGGQEMKLNSTPEPFSGVWLSKNDTGIIAQLQIFDLMIYFDGDTAHLIGAVVDPKGLCSGRNEYTDTTRLLNASLSDVHSTMGCEVRHNDSFNDVSHCNRSTQRCYGMKQDPFAACHSLIDPSPYVKACVDTSCNYPDVDGGVCRYLEAYAKSCYLLGHVAVENWRTMAGCSVVLQDACLNQHCSDHEFCGENLGEVRCLCRALFAAMYEPDSLGEPTDCTMQESVSVTLAVCLLWEKGIDYSVLHLNDPSCVGHLDEENHLVTFSFNDSNTCGMEVVTIGNKLLYKNTIRTMNTTSDITHHDQVEIDFSCMYEEITRNEIHSMGLRIGNSSVIHEFSSGIWNYTLTMSIYADPTHLQPVEPETEIHLNQKLWMVISTEGLDANLIAVVTEACWATGRPSAEANPRHNLISAGCSNLDDDTVETEGNGVGTSNSFSFNMFKFYAEDTELYLHCSVRLCPANQHCVPDCTGVGSRKRRSVRLSRADENLALVTMTWKKK